MEKSIPAERRLLEQQIPEETEESPSADPAEKVQVLCDLLYFWKYHFQKL